MIDRTNAQDDVAIVNIDPPEEALNEPNRFEVSVPLVVIVEDGEVVEAKVEEGWGGFFSVAEEASGVWDPYAGEWGVEGQEEIASVAWRWTRERIQ